MTGTLLVQAPILPPATLALLARQTGARAIIPCGAGKPAAYWMAGVTAQEGVVECAQATACDFGVVPDAQALDRVRVVAMDMDSTLITIECIDEIADLHGIKPEVAAITASAMRGEIDFAESLRLRVRLLAGLPVSALERVYDERLRITPGAERMLAGFRAVGAKTLLVSGGFTFFTERLKSRLGLDHAVANTLQVRDGQLTGDIEGPIVDARTKADTITAWKKRHAGAGGLVVTLGDGANDLPMFREADISIAYHAKPVARAAATYAIDHCGLDAALNYFR